MRAILFVGDSNIMRAEPALTAACPDDLPIFNPKPGASVRADYWTTRLPEVFAKITPDAIVCNLGINDTIVPGTLTTPGYALWGQKCAWFLNLLPVDVPVVWSKLPTLIEPPARHDGCVAVNAALDFADVLFPQVTVAAWNLTANGHPEWMLPGQTHYTPDGYTAYANLIAATLDTRAS